jgi:hypothetical protein
LPVASELLRVEEGSHRRIGGEESVPAQIAGVGGQISEVEQRAGEIAAKRIPLNRELHEMGELAQFYGNGSRQTIVTELQNNQAR